MKVSDILALAAAGFTAQQIAAINTAFAAEKSAPAQQPAQLQQLAPAQQPPAQPADPSAEILKQLGIISGQITAANITGSTQPPQQTADDILAEIIRPAQKGGLRHGSE